MSDATPTATTVGTRRDATLVAIRHYDPHLIGPDKPWPVRIGSGEVRTVYRVGDVVYKCGESAANGWEHDMLTAWRAAGAGWAPPTTLWTVELDDRIATVVAMPFIDDDGGDPDPGQLAEIRRACPQVSPGNIHVHAGQAYVIDGGDVDYEPATLRWTAPDPTANADPGFDVVDGHFQVREPDERSGRHGC